MKGHYKITSAYFLDTLQRLLKEPPQLARNTLI